MGAYACDACAFWHIGHSRRRTWWREPFKKKGRPADGRPTPTDRQEIEMAVPTVSFLPPEPDDMTSDTAVRSITGRHNPHLFTSPSGVVYELVHVTPELALEWLERNTNNRKLRTEVVAKLGRDLHAGRFAENGDAVRFDVAGKLADGQHRLHAIAASGTAAWLLVVSNLPETARDTVDDGAKRTMADRFAFHGEASPSTLAATVRRAILWSRSLKEMTARYQPSTLESFEFLAAHPELRDAAAAADHYRKNCMLGASTVGLCWWLFHQISPDQCREFFDRLADGAMLPPGHPVLVLRNRLADLARRPARMPERHIAALTIKSWNKYRAGENVVQLKFAETESFPTPK
jgi:hypothetical protein